MLYARYQWRFCVVVGQLGTSLHGIDMAVIMRGCGTPACLWLV